MADMKTRVVHIAITVLALIIGLVFGVLFQKYYLSESGPETSKPDKSNLPEEYQGKLQLFVLAGQSNMSGWGTVPSAGTTTNPRIYVFGNDYHWKLAKDPIDDPTDQVDKVSEDSEAGFGPALPFAAVLLERDPDMVVGLIPCAKGNSSLFEWQRSLSDETLYGSCLKRIRAASTVGEVAGILFFQGEADARDPKQNRKKTLLPDEWADNFAVVVNDWRTDLNAPDLPVVFAQIGTTTAPDKYPNWVTVQDQQQRIHLPSVAMIKTDDLPVRDDVHFTNDGYRMVGQRFAEAYLHLLGK